MSLEQNKTIVRQVYEEVNDKVRYDLLDELMTDDFVIHTPMPVPAPGRDGFRQLLAYLRGGFPIQHTAIHQLIAEGDLVVAHHTHHVTHSGEFMGMPPTGKEIAVQGIEIFRLADGRIVEMWHQDDMLSLFQQLSMISVLGLAESP
jgi:steroid delta-isomerase-like uncharacterized protein